MDIGKVKDFLGEDWRLFEDKFRSVLHSDVELLNSVNGRILDNGGKQLRPMLCLLSARACGKATGLSVDCAVTSELIHTATLLHDDVADNSPVRRGVPTIMSLFGPSVSVLIGDYWLSKAIALLVGNAGNEIILAFSNALESLAKGEMLQLQKASECDTRMEDYLRIISCKTAALFKAAVASGAYSVGAPERYVRAVSDYAEDLGLAFQMRDDIFDYVPQMNVGKNLGVDILEQKITLPLIEALERADAGRNEEIRGLVRNIHDCSENKDRIVGFVDSMDGVQHARKTLMTYSARAASHLAPLPESEEKKIFEGLALYVGERCV